MTDSLVKVTDDGRVTVYGCSEWSCLYHGPTIRAVRAAIAEAYSNGVAAGEAEYAAHWPDDDD
jgi:hypothetical protein